MPYKPIYTITNPMIERVAQIAELAGRLAAAGGLDRSPTLRRKNRILTVQGSLAIEQNSLTVEQVTAILSGKRVLAPPKDIAEVRNAFEIYEHMELLDAYSAEDFRKAHGVMMRGLLPDAGAYRERPVGVVDSRTGQVIHFGMLPAYVPEAMEQLFAWLRESDLHILLKSCIFHYEVEVIHPFLDGNGRMGRLWHTVLLAKWKPIFAWLPVESIIFRNQQEYYAAINASNASADSAAFIEFMLDAIWAAMSESIQDSIQDSAQDSTQDAPQLRRLLEAMGQETLPAQEIMERLGLSSRASFRKNYLAPALERGLIERSIPGKPSSKNQRYRRAGNRRGGAQ